MTSRLGQEAEKEVKSWGFKHVFTWTDSPYAPPAIEAAVPRTIGLLTYRCRNAHYSPHSHNGLTTHLILRGQLTILYPDDETPTKETFGVGERLDVDAKRKHEVWVGDEGCTYVIGE